MSAKNHNRWYRLDNAATIVPASARGSDTRVFRITCELKEEVNETLLIEALEQTLLEFPHMNVVLRKGLFWYYMDSTDLAPEVREEDKPACSPLYFPGRRTLLYRVNYFRRRINLEMFHVLADGTGGFLFIKKLVTNYLSIAHGLAVEIPPSDASSVSQMEDDAFKHFYSKEKGSDQLSQMTSTKAYQVRQYKDDALENHLLEITISAKSFIDLAHKYNTTAGILSVSLYIESVISSMRLKDYKRPIVVSVPVNLRQFFDSDTTRNFFGVINIRYDAHDYDGSLESILEKVKVSFEKQLAPESIRNTMNGYSALQHNFAARMVPLFIKDIAIGFFLHLTRKGTTATISNLGLIKMPKEVEGYIDRFSSFMANSNMQICISTFQDKMVFGVDTTYSEHEVVLRLVRRMVKLGLKVELGTNDYDAREE